MPVSLTGYITPLNAGFTGMVEDDQVIDTLTTSANIMVSDGSYYASVTMSGDATISANGTITINHGDLTNLGTGADHSYIDQDVTSGSTPTFGGGNITGVASIVAADESSDTTCFLAFVTAATGTLPIKTGSNLAFNSSSGLLTVTSFISNVSTGTAPFACTSTTLNTNLNADQVDSKDVGTSGNTIPLLDGTNDWSGVQEFQTTTKLQFRDPQIFIHSNADGELTIEADIKVTMGVAGNIELGDGTERDMIPQTTKNINLGTSSNKFNEVRADKVFTDNGIITKVSTDNVSSPPTDAELDTAFGTPATVGEGFIGLVDDNNAETDVWLCIAIGTTWWYEALTKAV